MDPKTKIASRFTVVNAGRKLTHFGVESPV